MNTAKRNKSIAEAAGLTECQVNSYFAEALEQTDGSWIVYFGVEADRDPEVASKLSPSKTLVIPKEVANTWFDRGNG